MMERDKNIKPLPELEFRIVQPVDKPQTQLLSVLRLIVILIT